nr:ferredoxin [Bacteroidales bacterium]
PKQPFVADIGILVSTDIVAIEAAAHDLVDKAHNCDDAFLKANSVSGKHQIDYAEQLGMGTKNYKLVNIDE